MSVQKMKIKKKPSNFTQISNIILQKLTNYEALGLYCYIASLPHDWEFHKNHLAAHADIGRDKLTKLLHILELHGLIKIEQIRGNDGRFSYFDMHVYDEEEFKIISEKHRNTENQYTGNRSTENQFSPLTEKPSTVNRLPENRTYKEDIKKYDNNKKEREREKPSLKLLSSRFKPSEKQKALSKEYNLDLKQERHKFIDYYQGKGEKRYKWQKYFTDWLERSYEYNLKNRSKNNQKESKTAISVINSRPAFNDPSHPDYEEYLKEKERLKKIEIEKENERIRNTPKTPERPNGMHILDYINLCNRVSNNYS